LEELLQNFASSQASDCQHRVFAMVGLASDSGPGTGLQVEYSWTPEHLLAKVLTHCGGDQDASFAALITNMLVPLLEYQLRLDYVEALLEQYSESQTNVQLRLHPDLLRELAATYSTLSTPTQYLRVKTCVVWTLVAARYFDDPINFRTIFRSRNGIDEALTTDVIRPEIMQALSGV
jgi:hypothetical protein